MSKSQLGIGMKTDLFQSCGHCWVFKICWHIECNQSCPTLCDPMDSSPPGFPIHEILQAGIREWVVMPSSMGSSPPRDQTCVSCVTYIAGGFFTTEPPGKPLLDTRRWKDWVHKISFWKYLTIWRSFLPVPPHPQHSVPHSWSPP